MANTTAHPETITISTTPICAAHGTESSRPLTRRSTGGSPVAGWIARVVAGVIGVLLGLVIGLVNAGFDTTRLLLALGAVALGVGSIIAVISDRTAITAGCR